MGNGAWSLWSEVCEAGEGNGAWSLWSEVCEAICGKFLFQSFLCSFVLQYTAAQRGTAVI